MGSETLSLYFELKEGEKADLEVVAKATLLWISTLRAAASAIDPKAQIRFEFVDAEEGSLRLNTILDWVESQLERIHEGASEHPRLRAFALGLALFVATTVAGHYISDLLDGEQFHSLSEDDRYLLEQILEKIDGIPEVESEGRRFFRTLESDPSITGVGITQDRDEIPRKIIPSTEFAERGGLWAIEEAEKERTLYPILDVILISPTLVSRPRSWKFQPVGLPEFSAKMEDKRFLAALDEDHVRERLRTGISMTIRLRVKEQKFNGDWVVKRGGRSVIEVISPKVD